MSSTAMAKKNKGKKTADPSETSKLLAAKISQLEQDAAGEKDQEAEIGVSFSLRSPALSHDLSFIGLLVSLGHGRVSRQLTWFLG